MTYEREDSVYRARGRGLTKCAQKILLPRRESRILLAIESSRTNQLEVLIELLIGLMSGIVWIPEFVAS